MTTWIIEQVLNTASKIAMQSLMVVKTDGVRDLVIGDKCLVKYISRNRTNSGHSIKEVIRCPNFLD